MKRSYSSRSRTRLSRHSSRQHSSRSSSSGLILLPSSKYLSSNVCLLPRKKSYRKESFEQKQSKQIEEIFDMITEEDTKALITTISTNLRSVDRFLTKISNSLSESSVTSTVAVAEPISDNVSGASTVAVDEPISDNASVAESVNDNASVPSTVAVDEPISDNASVASTVAVAEPISDEKKKYLKNLFLDLKIRICLKPLLEDKKK